MTGQRDGLAWTLSAERVGAGVTTPLRGGGVLLAEAVDVWAVRADGLTVGLRVEAVDGRLAATRVTVSGAVPVTAAMLRTVPVERLIRSAIDVSAPSPAGEDVTARVVATWRRFRADPATRHSATIRTADALLFSRGHVSRLLSRARREGVIGGAD